ncbi:condensin complex subunit 3-like [Lingula anatina]|uniref:Condensin complex subunit 3-like n=1 Tax=Lingula anatina TaxID=7574 RepID=A0A1S3HUY1_LINAN|nr:condensin complex subunit 3-like [Lingula anatina]|eukprot:XP_013389850.1 condensin complex subunit 3-like [Lingula anatina]
MAPQLSLKEVFTECQRGLQSHGKLIKMLKNIYDKTDLEEFWLDFVHHLKFSMVVFKREPAVERTLDFAVKFATSLNEEEKNTNKEEQTQTEEVTDDEVSENNFLLKMFDFLLQSHNARDRAVRFRCCQMINKLLNNLGEDAQIDDDLYDKIYNSMLQRLKDKFPIVRVQAVMAVARLQDPTDQDCPVIDAYLFLLSSDPNPDVRRAVLQNIAASTKTLPHIIERTRDVKDTVRKLAYQVLAEKIHIRALTIAQRVKLLQDGLNDRADMVKEACSSKLLQSWLRAFEGNVLELLKCLDVENSLKVVEQTLSALFQKVPAAELVQNFDQLNEELVLPTESLSCESVYYWHGLCKHLAGLGESGEEQLEMVLPPAVKFCDYIHKFIEDTKDVDDEEEQLRNEFIAQQLLTMTGLLDISDEMGRKSVFKLVHDLLVLPHVNYTLVKPLVTRLNQLQTNEDTRIATLVEIISDIREPITTKTQELSKEERRQIDLKVASIRVELNQLRDQLDQCVQQQEFEKAAEIKSKVSDLQTSKASLIDSMLPTTQEVREEKNDAATLLKCMTIAGELLQGLTIRELTPVLQTLIESLILPGFQNEDPAVRNAAVRALGLCCIISKEAARSHLVLFIQVSQVDQETVKITALKVIFDLLHIFGLEAFDVQENENTTQDIDQTKDSNSDSRVTQENSEVSVVEGEEKEEEADDQSKNTSIAASLVTILLGLLDSESSDMRTATAEGLAKLLLSGRMVSAKLLSRLLLLWFNPVTEDDSHLRHCLGTFFPVFAFAGRTNQEIVEQAFLPTLKTLFNAPASSPLADVNVSSVAELMTQLTSHKHLLQAPHGDTEIQESSVHDNLAVTISNEVLSDPNSFNVRTLVKVLNLLELSPGNTSNLKDLQVLADRMLEEVKEKQCVKALEKFQKSVSNLLQEEQLAVPVAEDTAAVNETVNDTTNITTTDAEKQTEESAAAAESISQVDNVVTDPVATEIAQPSKQVEDNIPDSELPAADAPCSTTTKGKKKGNPKTANTPGTAKRRKNKVKQQEEQENTDSDTENTVEASVFASPSPTLKPIRRRVPRKASVKKIVNFSDCLSESESENETAAKGRTRSSRNQALSDIENTVS